MRRQEDVSLLMVNYSNRLVMELALKSYVKHHYTGTKLKLGLVDNGSLDDSKEWLKENEIPFLDFQLNCGHENALNCLYNEVKTKYALICDTDVEFLENVITKYLPELNDETKLAGEYITRDQLNDGKVKPRTGAWFMLTDVQAMKANGIRVFRSDNNDWSYDVGSEYTEKILLNGYKIHHIPRLNADIDRDIKGMEYDGFIHYGKLSWNLNNHQDRESEVKMRMDYIIKERLPLYKDIILKEKFIGI